MNAISQPAKISPPPCRGRVRVGVEAPFHHHATPALHPQGVRHACTGLKPQQHKQPLQGARSWLALAFLFCAATAHAGPFANGDAEAGNKFFAQNNCNRCHDGIMGGDGNKIFTRINHKVKNPQQLVDQMHVCTGNIGVTLTPQDEQNLGAYLNQHYYHFK